MTDYQISRLDAGHAAEIVDCFRRVYGSSYANELFYDEAALARALAAGIVGSVGAIGRDGRIFGHMAMTRHPQAVFTELGNTVVDPEARGHGLAWQVGSALSAWCRELGYRGFLHYPTTDHHIMQRRSLERGFETGLMLGYIPAETDGKVRTTASALRQAATVVFEPYEASPMVSCYLPERFAGQVRSLAEPTGLVRTWLPVENRAQRGHVDVRRFPRRGLERLEVRRSGDKLDAALNGLVSGSAPCQQVDFLLDDAAVGLGVELAVASGFRFCGWLPGYRATDVLRLQRVDEQQTDLAPRLESPVARSLLDHYLRGT